jgi:transcriptional regulator with XRE-family HTH domain
METTAKTNKVHIGRKISRIREIRGIKQDVLATELGVSQQAISRIEQSEEVEESTIEKIAKILGVTKEAILNFSDEAVITYFNNFHDSSTGDFRHNCTFNAIDKVVELYNEKVELLERLLQSEREKVEILKEKLS